MESPALDCTAILPDEVLARIFQQLTAAHLHRVEAVNRRFRAVVLQHELWRQACIAAHPPLQKLLSRLDLSEIPNPSAQLVLGAEAIKRSLFYKKLHYRLTAPQAKESLIATPLAASSTDHPQESIDHLLSPEARSRDLLCYWSSAGSDDENSVEVLTFQLSHPLCLVTEIDLRPFKAFFQPNHPIYSPKAVRVKLGGLDCCDAQGFPLPKAPVLAAVRRMLGFPGGAPAPGAAGPPAAFPFAAGAVPVGPGVAMGPGVALGPGVWVGMGQPAAAAAPPPAAAAGSSSPSSGAAAPGPPAPVEPRLQLQTLWESPLLPVRHADELQRFEIEPTLCVGGLLQVELLGKVQRQDADQRLYTCLAYLRALGTPIYNFQVTSGPPGVAPPAEAAVAAGPVGERQQAQQQAQQQQWGPAVQEGVSSAPGLQQAQQQGQEREREQQHEHCQEQGEGEGSLQLRFLALDPLLQLGGLLAVSEGGRVWRLRQRAHALVGAMANAAGGPLAVAGQGIGGGVEEVEEWDDEEGEGGSDLWGDGDTDDGDSMDEDQVFGGLDWGLGEDQPFAD